MRAGQIFLGNGSDEAIDLAFRIFCEPGRDNAVSIAPTYGMYRVAAQTNDVELREVPLGADFSLPVEALLAAADRHQTAVALLAQQPHGNAFPDREIEELLRRFDGVVVLDEAYIDFAEGRGFLPRLDEFPNLIVLQTLSKAWGMAGLRLGLAFRVGADRRAVRAGQVSLQYQYAHPADRGRGVCTGTLRRRSRKSAKERGRLAAALAGCGCIEAGLPSQANFLLVKTADPDRLYGELIAAGVIVRNRTRIAGCEGCLRITVGTPPKTGACWKPSKTSDHEKSTQKALFIDRDGTLIVEPPVDMQVDSLAKLEFVPGAISALKVLRGLDFELVMATNQDGLGNRLLS